MEYQTFFNVVIGLLGVGLGMFMNRLFASLDMLRAQDLKLTEEITKIKVSLPTSYVTKTDLDNMASILFKKLDSISSTLDGKADKAPQIV